MTVAGLQAALRYVMYFRFMYDVIFAHSVPFGSVSIDIIAASDVTVQFLSQPRVCSSYVGLMLRRCGLSLPFLQQLELWTRGR